MNQCLIKCVVLAYYSYNALFTSQPLISLFHWFKKSIFWSHFGPPTYLKMKYLWGYLAEKLWLYDDPVTSCITTLHIFTFPPGLYGNKRNSINVLFCLVILYNKIISAVIEVFHTCIYTLIYCNCLKLAIFKELHFLHTYTHKSFKLSNSKHLAIQSQ